MPTPARPTYALCCILDQHPRFYVEFVLWVLCVKRRLPSDQVRCIVYCIGAAPEDLISWALGQGIECRIVDVAIPESPHCNKIIPFFESHSTDFVVVCDTDLFFVSDPSEIFRSERYRAPPNNHCNPPPHIFQQILARSGLGRKYRPGVALFPGNDGLRETHINNISAGLVISPSDRSNVLAGAWMKWAKWLVENREILGDWHVHVDQVAFALALEDLDEDVEFLPPQVNTILHLLDAISTCYAIHLTTGHIPAFPSRFNSDRSLTTTGLKGDMVEIVSRLNEQIRAAAEIIRTLDSTREHFDKFLNPQWQR